MLDSNGIPFKEACAILKKEYLTKSRAWASFGAYDFKQFQRQCELTGVGYPFGPSHINIKTLFALKKQLSHEQGMAGALEILKIPLEGTHHRGIDDANNIAKIMRWILNN
jgi:inhibitor of KinA sporulation pathway (predicted exonuclease)